MKLFIVIPLYTRETSYIKLIESSLLCPVVNVDLVLWHPSLGQLSTLIQTNLCCIIWPKIKFIPYNLMQKAKVLINIFIIT
jgi:hypothetical protein